MGVSMAVDYVRQFGREVAAFEAAARVATDFETAPAVPSCRGWVVTDLVLRLGVGHRFLSRVIGERIRKPDGTPDLARIDVPKQWTGWLPPGHAPQESPVPADLLDWFHDGAEQLEERLLLADPGEPVWTWSAADPTIGFWQRMQAIEAAVHRWDAEKAVGTPVAVDSALAIDAVSQVFEVMVPMQRTAGKAPSGAGERFLFRREDGPQSWAVRFDADDVVLGAAAADGPYDIEISGRASDLALFLWHRPVANQLAIQGNTRMIRRYFDLVPPLEDGRWASPR